MLIPCIDLQDGQAVQLVRGRKRELAVADVFGLLHEFSKYTWLHIIDLDAAMGKGSNDELVRALCTQARTKFKMKVRVGGGIRTVSRAEKITAWGANQIMVGSAVFRDGKVNLRFLRQITREVAAWWSRTSAPAAPISKAPIYGWYAGCHEERRSSSTSCSPG